MCTQSGLVNLRFLLFIFFQIVSPIPHDLKVMVNSDSAQVWAPHLKRDSSELERGQRRIKGMLRGENVTIAYVVFHLFQLADQWYFFRRGVHSCIVNVCLQCWCSPSFISFHRAGRSCPQAEQCFVLEDKIKEHKVLKYIKGISYLYIASATL